MKKYILTFGLGFLTLLAHAHAQIQTENRTPAELTKSQTEQKQNQQNEMRETPKPYLDVPLLDAPFTFTYKDYTFPSMRQSLALSTSFYEIAHDLIGGGDKIHSTQRWRVWPIVGFDLLTTWFPLSDTWLHEEWHRAVMSNRDIDSYNDVYDIPIGASTIAVSHVKDKDLERFKKDHPAEFVRMSAAGMESQVEQIRQINRHHFFDDLRTFDDIILLNNAIGVYSYLDLCASKEADTSTKEQLEEEGRSTLKRDFTGLDCDAWVYDLFRPKEPYSARGNHPSGVGYDRYIQYSDLTQREKDFLKTQVYLSLLNIFNPFIFRDEFDATVFGENIQWNATLNHFLTSFGYTVDANLFLKARGEKFLITLHNGFNYKTYFPGLTIEWHKHRLPWDKFYVTSHATVWWQPKDQYVMTKRSGVLTSANAEIQYEWQKQKAAYIGFGGKTEGWQTGEVALENNFSSWMGFRLAL